MRLEAPIFIFQQELRVFQSGLRNKAMDLQFHFGFVTTSLPLLSSLLLNLSMEYTPPMIV
jgi:hypothetical protein